MYNYQRIKDLREDNDLLQKQVCTIIDCQQQQYQLYESGKREIPFHSVIKLANYYNVSLDYIAGRTNDKLGLSHSKLPNDETDLLQKFRSLSNERKIRILERLEILFEEQETENNKIKGAI